MARLEGLEDHRAAASVLSIDFEKAFNRMGHRACLDAISNLGAANPTVGLVHVFLEGRTMSVRFSGTYSEARAVPGGSPQGSIPGNYLFCATTDQLAQNIDYSATADISYEQLSASGDVSADEIIVPSQEPIGSRLQVEHGGCNVLHL